LTQTLPPTKTQIPLLTPTLTQTPTKRPTITPEPLSEEANAYLEEALKIMQEYSIDKYNVDWDELRSLAFIAAGGASQHRDTHAAISFILGKLGNGHSYLVKPSVANKLKEGSSLGNTDPIGKIIDGKFGYILIPGFQSISDDVSNDFATDIQKLIREIDPERPCAWIVDLRENDGGNLMAMLAGIGPILGEGCFVSFVDADGEKTQLCYENGVAYGGPLTITSQVNEIAYETTEQGLPVAVLTSNNTASAGEVIVLALRGRPNTQSFGYQTAGYSTANWVHEMSDGALIVVTFATYADRTGQLYGGKIAQDVKTETIDELPLEVQEWLLEQPSCKIEE
jgi:C-terminal processing protease CtpA/Prc